MLAVEWVGVDEYVLERCAAVILKISLWGGRSVLPDCQGGIINKDQ